MSVQQIIRNKVTSQLIQRRSARYLVLSKIALTALKHEITGLLMESAVEADWSDYDNMTFEGMRVTVLDRDDLFVEVG
ncbi:hypothetical protein D3C81_1520900 [compost metagenome]